MSGSRRWRVLERDGFTCQYCGRSAPDVILEVDHVYPRSVGGRNDFSNLVTACRTCNQGKKDRDGTSGLMDRQWSISVYHDGRAQSMLEVLVGAYALELGCTTGDVWEWLAEEVS